MNPTNGTTSPGRTSGGTMLRMLGAAQKREVKATQNLSIIVLFFMICWIPLYTINFILAFCDDCFKMNSTLMLFCIILSHLNSAGNPLLYAYHLTDFRAALKSFLIGLFISKKEEENVGIGAFQNGRLSMQLSNVRRDTRTGLAENRVPNLAVVLPVPSRLICKITEEGSMKRSRSSTSSGHINYAFSKRLETGDDDVFYENNSCSSRSDVDIVTNTLERLRANHISSSSPHLALTFHTFEELYPRCKRKVRRSYSTIECGRDSSSSLEEFQFPKPKHSKVDDVSDDSGAISDQCSSRRDNIIDVH